MSYKSVQNTPADQLLLSKAKLKETPQEKTQYNDFQPLYSLLVVKRQ